LERHAAEVKAANGRFWNEVTGRFVLGIDDAGERHDYGFTFMNLEAIYYDYATAAQAESILRWISGERLVAEDTARGADIYYWRFGPRATTRRNIDWYGWFWSGPESIPWGGQVQDGGAVLGFAYHDLMARLRVYGADDAWQRLREIITWYEEVQAAGGPRKYYETADGTLQGCGKPGGLGVDCEFYESILVPQVMLSGFAGFAPTPAGVRIVPQLPRDWPKLAIERVHLQGRVVRVQLARDLIELHCTSGAGDGPLPVELPPGEWNVTLYESDGATRRLPGPPFVIGDEWLAGGTVLFSRETGN
jgi:hypothetical protein